MQRVRNNLHQIIHRLYIVLSVGFLLLPKVAIALQPPSNLDDTDHAGTDWTISASTVIAGKHTNLRVLFAAV